MEHIKIGDTVKVINPKIFGRWEDRVKKDFPMLEVEVVQLLMISGKKGVLFRFPGSIMTFRAMLSDVQPLNKK